MYKKGDILEVTGNRYSDHGFRKGDQVRVDAAYEDQGDGINNEHYKCTHDDLGRKTSWHVDRRDLVKRRKK